MSEKSEAQMRLDVIEELEKLHKAEKTEEGRKAVRKAAARASGGIVGDRRRIVRQMIEALVNRKEKP